MTSTPHKPGLLAWFASNPIAANLLMLVILIGGLVGFRVMDKEVFPRFNLHQIEINATSPNQSPLEMEDSVCSRIELAVYDLPGVKQLNTEIYEDQCIVKVSALPDTDQDQLINSLRSKIQSIPRLPKDLEAITVEPAKRNDDDGVIWISLHGATTPLMLQQYGEHVRSDLERIPGVRWVRNYGEIPYEISIEISPLRLQQHGLALHDITDAIRRTSLNQSNGLIKTAEGELQITTTGKAGDAEALSQIVLRTQADGSTLRLGDVASIRDGLEERLSEWHYNGETAQGWEIHTKSSAVEVARRVKDYVAATQQTLPQGLSMSTWWDDSLAYDERVQALVEDGLGGFVLVCLVLTLFLRLRVAVWAGVGIFTSVLGALWLMPVLGVSLNMLSLFGFLLAMGILVDDAIIIGDSVYSHQEEDKAQDAASSLSAAIKGVQAVALPVTLSVIVSLVAFLPGLFLPGWAGQLMQPVCLVMILTLVFSLVEALLILPAHLAAPTQKRAAPSYLSVVRAKLNGGLEHFVDVLYRPFLHAALAWRYLTATGFIVLMLVCAAWVDSGRIRLSLQADVVKDSFWVQINIPKDMAYSEAKKRATQVEQAFFSLRNDLDKSAKDSVVLGLETIIQEHWAGFWTEFSPQGRERINVEDFINEWRKRIGDLGRTKIDFLYKEGDQPYDLTYDISATDPAVLPKAAEQLKAILARYAGVYDVIDSAEPGKPEVRLTLKPNGQRLGLRLENLSGQVRNAYYGDEVGRLQRGRSEVKVMVRLPRTERESLDDLNALPVQIVDAQFVPLSTVAELSFAPSVTTINRQDRNRVIKVQARVDAQKTDLNALTETLEATELKSLSQQFTGLTIALGQELQEQRSMMTALKQNTLIALLVIYVLIAVPFRSYLKPLIFLLAAPVAWCGAVIAHGLSGLPLSMESLVGMIAASGVVVNDSLVLLDYLRENEDQGKPLSELIADACTSRFRPIFLAFLTNFAGFLPALLETSPQAQFLIPMTLSLSAGLLLGMAASLILTPVCYAILVKEN